MKNDLALSLSLLSSMYLCPATIDSIGKWRELFAAESLEAFKGIDGALTAIDLKSERELEDLSWEHTRLLIGPYKLASPPWESVYSSPARLLMQAPYYEVSHIYSETGLAMSNSGVMADHVGVELNFLAVLLNRMEEDPGTAVTFVPVARKFFERHLKSWISRFATDLENAANLTLYKELARATRALMDRLDSELPATVS